MILRNVAALSGITLLAAICLTAAPAHAQIPFTESSSGLYGITSVITPTEVQFGVSGTGTSSPGGAFTVTGSFVDNFANLLNQTISNGNLSFDYGGGTTLQATFSGTAINNMADTGGTSDFDVLITGGTGQFSDMIGTGTYSGSYSITPNPFVDSYTQSFTGSFVPEPGSLAFLIGMALPGTGWLICRRRRK